MGGWKWIVNLFWSNIWVINFSLSKVALNQLLMMEFGARVADYWVEDNG